MRLNCCKLFHSSAPLTHIPLPSPGELHLWCVIPNELKGESLLKKYMEVLSPYEKVDVLCMHGDELRKSALLARTLVRTTIARYQINSSIPPRSLKFKKNIHGKPEVDWQQCDHCEPPPLHFNISHTSSLIACGVTVNSPIGVDVEAKHRSVKHNILTLARRYFSEHELQVLTAIKEPHLQHQEFIKLWTLKVSEISVDLFDDPSDLTGNWRFMLLELAGSHYAAICTEKDVISEGTKNGPMTVWKTIPFVEDKCVSGTEAVQMLCGSR